MALLVGTLAFALAPPAYRSKAMIDLPPGAQGFNLRVELVTTAGATHSSAVAVEGLQPEAARDKLLAALENQNWSVRPVGDTGVTVVGFTLRDKSVDPIAKLVLTVEMLRSLVLHDRVPGVSSGPGIAVDVLVVNRRK